MVDFSTTKEQDALTVEQQENRSVAAVFIFANQRKGESIRSVCKRLAPGLEINHKYLYQIAFFPDKYPPSKKLINKIRKEHRKQHNGSPQPVRRIITFEPSQEHLADYLDSLSMGQRRKMVESWYLTASYRQS